MRITSPDLGSLAARFAEEPEKLDRLLLDVVTETTRIAADEVTRRAPVRSGRLRRAIRKRVTPGKPPIGEVFVDPESGPAAYAEAVEFGSRPHDIVPRFKSVLAFPSGGKTVYTKKVHHPGTAGLHFFEDGVTAAEEQAGPILERAADVLLSDLAAP